LKGKRQKKRMSATEAMDVADVGADVGADAAEVAQEETVKDGQEEDEEEEPAATGVSKIPEFEPPQSSVTRIVKHVLPESMQVSKEARAAFTRAAGIFIFYLTHCSNDFCKDRKRSTIMTPDVIEALKELEFSEFIEPLENYIATFKQEQIAKKQKTNKGVSDEAEADDGNEIAEANDADEMDNDADMNETAEADQDE
jgi:DNA polymerase epsilon subunit 3